MSGFVGDLNKLDIHHIFPKDWCAKREISPKRFNSILNKTPISYKANRMIGGKAPSEYIQQLQAHKSVQLSDGEMDELLATHCLDPALLRGDDYDGFVEARRNALVGHISNVMGKPVVETGEAVAEDDEGGDDGDE